MAFTCDEIFFMILCQVVVAFDLVINITRRAEWQVNYISENDRESESTRTQAEAIQIHWWQVSRSLCHLNSNQLKYQYIVFETA